MIQAQQKKNEKRQMTDRDTVPKSTRNTITDQAVEKHPLVPDLSANPPHSQIGFGKIRQAQTNKAILRTATYNHQILRIGA